MNVYGVVLIIHPLKLFCVSYIMYNNDTIQWIPTFDVTGLAD